MGIIGAILAFVNGIFALWKNLFGGKSKEPSLTSTANEMGKISADTTRTTSAQLEKDLNDVQDQTSTSLGSVRNAARLRDAQQTVSDAIERANSNPSGDR